MQEVKGMNIKCKQVCIYADKHLNFITLGQQANKEIINSAITAFYVLDVVLLAVPIFTTF